MWIGVQYRALRVKREPCWSISLNNSYLAMSLQPGTSVNPRFVFGVEGKLPNNLHLLADHQLVYTAGNNVVVYSAEDKSQYFYSGNEDTQGITAITVSPGGKYIAICERDEARGA